jgi:hypothetical protein
MANRTVSDLRRPVSLVWVVAVASVLASCSGQPSSRDQDTAGNRQPAAAPAGSRPGAAATPSGGPEGFVERISCDEIRGWAWDPSQPDSALSIELYDGDRLLKTAVADQFRQDLVDARKGNGRHLFSEVPPPELRDGKPHTIRAVVKGTGITLRPLADTPSSMTCPR